MTSKDLNKKATRLLEDLIDAALHFPELRKKCPKNLEWKAGVQIVGGPEIRKLNRHYRKKDYATDVLSFGAPEPFWSSGYLGELVVGLPVLKRQAKEFKHSVNTELTILITHGLLHLLGLDHERGKTHARKQAQWEARLLAFTDAEPRASLITRSKK